MAMQICITAKNTVLKLGDRLRQERGQSMVEFAIVLPVLILIILGILYFGRYMEYSNQETQLAEEGVRWAAVDFVPTTAPGCTPVTLQCYIQSQTQGELRNGSSDVSSGVQVYIYSPTGATYTAGQPIRVCLVSTVKYPTPVSTLTSTIVQSATMRIEQTNGTTTSPYASGNVGTMPSSCPTS
jgi:hypothetical protein